MADKQKSRIACIREFFGKGENLAEFKKEIDKLTDDDKTELAIGSAKNLGYTQEDVDFPLK